MDLDSTQLADDRPPSEDSRRWLNRLRRGVRNRLFGDSAPPPSPSSPHPGSEASDPTRIGRYVVIKRTGAGGMGVVYAAYDDTLDRKIAVKLLRPERSAGSSGRARMLREAQALARLSHPSVIHVYDVGTFGDQVYVAMEYVDGPTLKAWQSGDARTWREILDVYLRAGRGLAAAHAAGIVHRDFKADNVLVGRGRSVRVIDFGLARTGQLTATTDDAPTVEDVESIALTRTGTIMGTPAYMAPEQHLGAPTDPRTDQFAFCVSLHEALYGYRPFAGDSLEDVRKNVLAGKVEDAPRFSEVPPRTRRALLRGLRVDPQDRYVDMESLLEDLARDPRVWINRALYALVAVTLVGVVFAFWWKAREERFARAEAQRLRAEFERARVMDVEREIQRARGRTVSEKWDDLVLAYARQSVDVDPTRAIAALEHLTPENSGWLGAARMIAAEAELRGIVHREHDAAIGHAYAMTYTPDGRTLAVAGSDGKVALWSPESGESRWLQGPQTSLRDLSLDAAGTVLAAAGEDGSVHVWTLGSDEYRALPLSQARLWGVALSPDAKKIVAGGADGKVRLATIDGTVERVLRDHGAAVRSVAFAPSGDTMASASDDGTVRVWFLSRSRHRVLEGHSGGVQWVRFLEEDVVASADDEGELVLWSTHTGAPLVHRGSPDVAAVAVDRTAQTFVTVTMDGRLTVDHRNGGLVRELTHRPATITAVAVSPSGDEVAAVTRDGAVQTWRTGRTKDGRRRLGGPARPPRDALNAHRVSALAFTSDGTELAAGSRTGQVLLWEVGRTDDLELYRHERAVTALRFSSDDRRLAVIDEDGAVLVIDRSVVHQSPRTILARGTGWTAWSADGRRIAAQACAPSGCTIRVSDLESAETFELAVVDAVITGGLSPDGTTLLTDHESGTRLWHVDTGEESQLRWDSSPGRRMGLVFLHDGSSARMATARGTDDPSLDGATLRVWHISLDGGQPHLLFEEEHLEDVVSGRDGTTLLVQTFDDRSLVWSLQDDRIRLLPGVVGRVESMWVSPTRDTLLVRLQDDRWLRLVDIASGHARRIPPLNDPIAWSARGLLVDVDRRSKPRIWPDPTPDDPTAFMAWLDDATGYTLDAGEIR